MVQKKIQLEDVDIVFEESKCCGDCGGVAGSISPSSRPEESVSVSGSCNWLVVGPPA